MEDRVRDLRAQKTSLDKRISSNLNEIELKKEDNKKLSSRIGAIEKELNLYVKVEIDISEHATMRLLERRYGQEEMIKAAVSQIKGEIKGKANNMRCKITLDDGLVAVIENNTIITVI